MDDHDRKEMVKDLTALGLHKDLLDSLSTEYINRLFNLIGWASPVFTRDQVGIDDDSVDKKDDE
tara:strand:+ start:646 stop:837 length:192 start_codon:yes stop_codon:yes gene_type:complete